MVILRRGRSLISVLCAGHQFPVHLWPKSMMISRMKFRCSRIMSTQKSEKSWWWWINSQSSRVTQWISCEVRLTGWTKCWCSSRCRQINHSRIWTMSHGHKWTCTHSTTWHSPRHLTWHPRTMSIRVRCSRHRRHKPIPCLLSNHRQMTHSQWWTNYSQNWILWQHRNQR